jgi:hypothetical protein
LKLDALSQPVPAEVNKSACTSIFRKQRCSARAPGIHLPATEMHGEDVCPARGPELRIQRHPHKGQLLGLNQSKALPV